MHARDVPLFTQGLRRAADEVLGQLRTAASSATVARGGSRGVAARLLYIKQMVTNRFKDHPAFAGHSFSAWCKTLKNHDAPAGPGRRSIMKFSFEYTQHAEKH